MEACSARAGAASRGCEPRVRGPWPACHAAVRSQPRCAIRPRFVRSVFCEHTSLRRPAQAPCPPHCERLLPSLARSLAVPRATACACREGNPARSLPRRFLLPRLKILHAGRRRPHRICTRAVFVAGLRECIRCTRCSLPCTRCSGRSPRATHACTATPSYTIARPILTPHGRDYRAQKPSAHATAYRPPPGGAPIRVARRRLAQLKLHGRPHRGHGAVRGRAVRFGSGKLRAAARGRVQLHAAAAEAARRRGGAAVSVAHARRDGGLRRAAPRRGRCWRAAHPPRGRCRPPQRRCPRTSRGARVERRRRESPPQGPPTACCRRAARGSVAGGSLRAARGAAHHQIDPGAPLLLCSLELVCAFGMPTTSLCPLAPWRVAPRSCGALAHGSQSMPRLVSSRQAVPVRLIGFPVLATGAL